VIVVQAVHEGALGALVARDLVGLGREQLAPFGVGFDDPVDFDDAGEMAGLIELGDFDGLF